ncbi:MAG: universal stress protein [Pseudomonadota bacterium]
MLSYKNILVPVDFEKGSESAIIKAANHSEASDSLLMVAHVIDSQTLNQGEPAETAGMAEARLDALLDSLEIGYCEKLVVEGDTVDSLLRLIQQHNIDLVVMGTAVKEEPSRLVKSITVAVVTNTECDVLVLHK